MINESNREMVGKPSIHSQTCVVCGRPATDNHHVIPKGMGGSKERIPTLSLCGFGNTSGCHGLAHSGRLHFAWRNGWVYLQTEEPVSYLEALEMDGWQEVRG